MRLVILSSGARQHGCDRQGVALAKSRAHGCARIDFPLLRSWQKPRFLPAETKLMSEKAPQATFSNEQGSRSYAAECRCASRRVRRQMIESKAAWMVSQRLGVFDGSFTVSPYSVDGCDGGADAVAGARQEP
jgi:hypothetical protein